MKMPNILAVACLLGAATYAHAQTETDVFRGGAGDGHDAVSGTINFDNAALAVIFTGGAGDGHYAVSGSINFDNAALAVLFTGGTGDGHDARSGTVALSGGALSQLYTGGTDDGHSASSGAFVLMAPVPATLLSFTATPTADGTVDVAWTVADERDVDHYAVERGADAASFTEVDRRAGVVAAGGRAHTYGLTDATPIGGTSYYRLRTVDDDGSYDLSEVVVVTLPSGDGDTWTLAVFPNPLAEGQSLQLASDGLTTPAPLVLTVYDAVGRLAARQSLQSAGGREVFSVSGFQLASGTYRLHVAHPVEGVRSQVLTVVP